MVIRVSDCVCQVVAGVAGPDQIAAVEHYGMLFRWTLFLQRRLKWYAQGAVKIDVRDLGK